MKAIHLKLLRHKGTLYDINVKMYERYYTTKITTVEKTENLWRYHKDHLV